MTWIALYRRHRPGTFTDVLGQNHVVDTLTAAVREGRVGHAYLFSGPRGTGKTSTARILARALNCENGPTDQPCGTCTNCTEITAGISLDVYEMDAASHTSVEDIREIRERIPFAAVDSARKVYVIDEAHMLSTAAFNALLKMLEEPPPHVVFVLCTTEPHKLPATVISRCQRFEFRRVGSKQIVDHLAAIAATEGVEVEPAALELIANHGGGSVRDSLSLLDQAIGGGTKVDASIVRAMVGEAPAEVMLEVSGALAANEIPRALTAVDQLCSRGWDPRALLRQLLEHLRGVYLAHQGAADVATSDETLAEDLKREGLTWDRARLEHAMRSLAEAQSDVRASTHPRLALEMALVAAVGSQVAATTPRAQTPTPSPEPKVPSRPTATVEPSSAAAEPKPAPVEPAVDQPAPAPSQPEPTPTASDSSESAEAQADPDAGVWDRILEIVRNSSRVTFTHLRAGRPLGIKGDAFLVEFSQKFHADTILAKPDQLERVVKAIAEVTGQRLRFSPVNGDTTAEVPQQIDHASDAESGSSEDPEDLLRASFGATPVERK